MTMNLTFGKTYLVTATPKDSSEYVCSSILVEKQQPKDFKVAENSGIGTATFKMDESIKTIDATFSAVPKSQDVVIGNDSEGTSSDGHGTITVEEEK